MSLFTENVVPGETKVFGTNAKYGYDLEAIKKIILSIDGIKDVILDDSRPTKEFTITSTKIVPIELIEKEVKKAGFHVVPKGII